MGFQGERKRMRSTLFKERGELFTGDAGQGRGVKAEVLGQQFPGTGLYPSVRAAGQLCGPVRGLSGPPNSSSSCSFVVHHIRRRSASAVLRSTSLSRNEECGTASRCCCSAADARLAESRHSPE